MLYHRCTDKRIKTEPPRASALRGATLLLLSLSLVSISGPVSGAEYRMTLAAQNANADAASKLFREAREALKDEKWSQAQDKFSQFINRYPDHKEVDAALYWLALTFKKQDMLQDTSDTLERLLREFPQSSWADDAKALRIEIAARLGKKDVINEGINGNNDEIRLTALQSLLQSSPERAAKLAMDILKPDSAASSALKEGAVMVLSDSGEKEAIPALIEVARNANDMKLRRRAIEALGNVNDDGVVDFLSEMATKSDDRDIARAAVNALADQSSPRVSALLLEVARSAANIKSRAGAILQLGERGDESVIDEMVKLYEKDKGEDIRSEIISALAEMNNLHSQEVNVVEISRATGKVEIHRKGIPAPAAHDKAINILIQLYDSESEEQVKSRILTALSNSQNKRGLRKLIEVATNSPSPTLKAQAVSLLEESDDPEAAKFSKEGGRKP
jgi:HEAT repeat protein